MTPRPRLRAAGSPSDRTEPRVRTAGAAGGPRRAAANSAYARAGRRRLMTIGAALVLALALTALTNQYRKTYTLARDEARLEQRRREIIADNARLREEIDRLLNDDRYIEQIARAQLGLVRPGEVELLVVPYEGTVSPPGRTPRGAPARTPARDGSIRPSRPAAIDDGRPQTGVNQSHQGAGASPDGDAATPLPHRGIGVWVIGARDAVLRLFHSARH